MKAPALHFFLTAKATNRIPQAWEYSSTYLRSMRERETHRNTPTIGYLKPKGVIKIRQQKER
ncbi:MAG: hypothetical protein LBG98_02855 [Puniceicoccales bacterium]|nr:hypothetical protein [Puniceicoccales bacterium]